MEVLPSVKDGVLYISHQTDTGEKFFRIIIPKHKQEQVLRLAHDELGHLGRDKVMSIAQERFFWVGLTKAVEHKLKTCRRCLCAKAPHLPHRAPLVSIESSSPLELVCTDFVGLEESLGRYPNILVITDHFTKYSIAVPTRNQEAKTVAKILVDEFIVHYGIPKKLHSDQGGSFEAKVIHQICKLLGIKKSRTTAYHPEGNGITERYNRTLISMLKSLEPAKKVNWKAHLAPLCHAYNCTKHESTGYSPFYLMFGRAPRLPIDVFLGVPEETGIHSIAYDVKERLTYAYKAASEAVEKARANQKKIYDRKVRGADLECGDFVLVKNLGLKGKHKIADRWKPELYIVVEHPNPDVPVYKVRPEDGAVEKLLHRNHLLPLVLPWPEERSKEIEDVHDDELHLELHMSDTEDEGDELEVHVVRPPLPEPLNDSIISETPELPQSPGL